MKNNPINLILWIATAGVMSLVVLIGCESEQALEPQKIYLADIISEVRIGQSYGDWRIAAI